MKIRKLVVSLGLVAFAAGPAAALENLSGNWGGVWKCTGLHEGAVSTTSGGVDMVVTHTDDGVVLDLHGVKWDAFVVADAAKPSTGIVTGVSCGGIDTDGTEGMMVHLSVKTKPGRVKATMKGEYFIMGRSAGHAKRCRFTAYRKDGPPTVPVECAPPQE
jgi:hypothetical protein